jgi:hypothetical protein
MARAIATHGQPRVFDFNATHVGRALNERGQLDVAQQEQFVDRQKLIAARRRGRVSQRDVINGNALVLDEPGASNPNGELGISLRQKGFDLSANLVIDSRVHVNADRRAADECNGEAYFEDIPARIDEASDDG